MVYRHFLLILFLATGLLLGRGTATAAGPGPEAGNSAGETGRQAETAPEPGQPALVELNTHLNRLPRRLVDLRRLVTGEGDRPA